MLSEEEMECPMSLIHRLEILYRSDRSGMWLEVKVPSTTHSKFLSTYVGPGRPVALKENDYYRVFNKARPVKTKWPHWDTVCNANPT